MDIPEFDENRKEELLYYLDPMRMSISDEVGQDAYENTIYRSFLTALDVTGFVAAFDYGSWMSDLKDMNDPALIEQADLDFLRKLVTAHIRLGRYLGGHLEELLQNGYFVRVLERLKEL